MLNANEQEKDGDGQTKAEPGGKTSEGNADDPLQTEKSDKLWASFLSDVGSRPKDDTPSAQSQTAPTVTALMLKIVISLIEDTDIFDLFACPHRHCLD